MKQYKLNINLNDNTTIKTATALPVPDKTSDLTNDSGFLTAEADTLATVTARGATTTSTVTFNPAIASAAAINVYTSGTSSSGLSISQAGIGRSTGANATAFSLKDGQLDLYYGASCWNFTLNKDGITKRSNPSTSYTVNFPSSGGTFALTSNFSVVTTSGSQSVTANGNTLTFGSNAFNSTTIPTSYLASASASGNTLTITPNSGSAITYTPSFTDTNYYATSNFNSTNGTKIATGHSGTSTSTTYDLYVPNATDSQAGVITTSNQTFAGQKTFNDTITLSGAGGAIVTSSGSNIQNNVINGGMVIENVNGGYTSYGKTGIGGMTDDSNTFNLNFPSKSGTITVDADIIGRQIKEVDAVIQPTNSSNYVVYHITDSTITSLTEGLTIRVHKGLASSWPKDSSGALKLIQINNLDPIAIFWRYNSFASWNSFDNVMMTLTYSTTARPSSSDYYGYKSQAGFILDFTYDSGNDTYNLYDYGGYHTGSSALTAYSLVGWDAAGNRVPVINADGTVGVAFDYSRGVQYWETAVNASQNRAPWTGSAWYPRVTATILSSLITRYGFGTLATTDRIYIKCSKSGRMLTPIALTKTLPSTKDSYYYMLFAKPYQEYTNYTSNQTWTIFINQPIYYHNGSAVIPLESDDSNVVHKTGNETIAGTKTFSSGAIKLVHPTYSSQIATLEVSDNEGVEYLGVDMTFKAPAIVAENSIYADRLAFGLATNGDTDYGFVLPSVNEMVQWTANRTIAAREDITNMQSTSVVVGNATTNINGRVFQNYTATLVTSGGYTFYQILKNGNNPTEDEAKEYMRYMAGSTFLPKYNYDFPKQTIFTFTDRSTWKPQYSSSDGLRLYRLTTPLALESDIPELVDISSVARGYIDVGRGFYQETASDYWTVEKFDLVWNSTTTNVHSEMVAGGSTYTSNTITRGTVDGYPRINFNISGPSYYIYKKGNSIYAYGLSSYPLHILKDGTDTNIYSGLLDMPADLSDKAATAQSILDSLPDDTKNTAGSTNDTSLLYLIGAKTQAANPQTYSRNNTYINANGVLVNTAGFSSESAGRSDYAAINIGYNAVNYYSGSGPASFKATSSTHGSWQISDNGGNIYLQKTSGSASSGSAYLLFPNVGTSSSPKTLATDEDVVHRTGDTMTDSLILNAGSGYSSSPNIAFVTPNGGGSLYKSDETLIFTHTGVHSYTLTFPMQTGTVALTSQIPPRIQILDYRS